MSPALLGLLTLGAAALAGVRETPAARSEVRPNVILIVTDDQGYGDLGINGNPIVRTPNIDAMAGRSARMRNFYVSPVCTPTRASLMTGRYNYRTRAIDTYRGRAMMDPGEVTVAEVLSKAGYATGLFGKWHLGDTYPLRPQDHGFQEVLMHRGGGIGQPSDPPGGEGKYTDPILFRNGREVPMQGYCTDIYFREGMQWAEQNARRKKPFFLYLPTNAPHGPYADVPKAWLEYYRKQEISLKRFSKAPGHPVSGNIDADVLARVYAMISNIDDNVGRLFQWLDRNQLTQNTLVIFITDNGPATAGYNAGFRGRKTDVYEGGIRSPFYAQWPARLKAGFTADQPVAHLDVLPTLLEACRVPPPAGVRLDGRSFLPLLEGKPVEWPERDLVFQAHRGDAPVPYHNFALRSGRWKLLCNSGFGREQPPSGAPAFELYDLEADPFEERDLARSRPRQVGRLRQRYDEWFRDVSSTRPDNYAPPRIQVGTRKENPVVLTRQDWRGANWGLRDHGYWEVNVNRAGRYDLLLRFPPPERSATAAVTLGSVREEKSVPAGATQVSFPDLRLPAGPGRLDAFLRVGDATAGVMFVEVSQK